MDVAFINFLDSIIGTSTSEDFKRRAIKSRKFFNSSRSKEIILRKNVCADLHHITKLVSAVQTLRDKKTCPVGSHMRCLR